MRSTDTKHTNAPRVKGNRWQKANVVCGLLLLATLIIVLTHLDDERRFLVLLTHLNPAWFLVAAGCQVGTYICAAAVWHDVLHRAGVPIRVRALVPLGLAKLFVDQIVPTAGVGGTMLVVHGLVRRGVPLPLATAALLVDLLSFYAAHALAVLLALGIIWVHHDLPPVLLTLVVLFVIIAVGIPLTILRLNRRGSRVMPPWVPHLPLLTRVVQAMAVAPADILRDRWLLLQTSGLQFAIVVLDAATLEGMLHAVGHPLAPAAVFASFTMSALLAILGVIPGGLGLFEGGAVAMLRWFDVPVEAGLAATLLLRAGRFGSPWRRGYGWPATRHTSQGHDGQKEPLSLAMPPLPLDRMSPEGDTLSRKQADVDTTASIVTPSGRKRWHGSCFPSQSTARG